MRCAQARASDVSPIVARGLGRTRAFRPRRMALGRLCCCTATLSLVARSSGGDAGTPGCRARCGHRQRCEPPRASLAAHAACGWQSWRDARTRGSHAARCCTCLLLLCPPPHPPPPAARRHTTPRTAATWQPARRSMQTWSTSTMTWPPRSTSTVSSTNKPASWPVGGPASMC